MTLPPPDPHLIGTEYQALRSTELHPTQAGMVVGAVLGFLLGCLTTIAVGLVLS